MITSFNATLAFQNNISASVLEYKLYILFRKYLMIDLCIYDSNIMWNGYLFIVKIRFW